MKSNSFACLHQQVAYEELCTNQPIYNNVPYEENELNYELFAGNCYDNSPHNPLKSSAHDKRHSVSNSDSSSQIGSSLIKCTLNSGGSSSLSSSQSNSDSSESSSRSDIIFVSANAVKYSASKYGVLMKREKILFVDHTRKFWAAVLSSTMYVYNGEKEPKPCLVIHLEGYTARDSNIGVSGTKAKDWVFEIVCPGKKTYQVIIIIFNSKLHCLILRIVMYLCIYFFVFWLNKRYKKLQSSDFSKTNIIQYLPLK